MFLLLSLLLLPLTSFRKTENNTALTALSSKPNKPWFRLDNDAHNTVPGARMTPRNVRQPSNSPSAGYILGVVDVKMTNIWSEESSGNKYLMSVQIFSINIKM